MFQLTVHTLEVIEESQKIFEISRGPASRPYASLSILSTTTAQQSSPGDETEVWRHGLSSCSFTP